MADLTTTESLRQLHVSANSTDGIKEENAQNNPEYVAFVLVPIFFLLGLFGVLICHVLKRKGYRCTTDSEEETEIEKDPDTMGDMNDTFSECNVDTVGQIVDYIMKNEANSEALNAMFDDNSIDPESPMTPSSPATPVSPASPTKHTCYGNHLHTIGGVAEKNICTRCNQKKWPLMRQSSKVKEARRSQTGEITVLSVGRFRVTKPEHKAQKERKSLLSESEDGKLPLKGSKGDPGTPAKDESKSRTTSETQEKNNTPRC
ncbi:RELT-like protein 1 [Lepisosteus oculatus]|uniref:RELT like 1 n=1 Tax=Lepisosteus oculatus TaxID=7918 RepID=W5MTS3_LEPOC|nr:PREDICTED: RELT-like protein 1 [Lepisosteus oculatus]XP_015200354.1 PREDICTED: RELT-like protein 1 [Lepisosteus oculatus]